MKRVCHPVSHVISLLVSTSPALFQPTTNTEHHLDSTTLLQGDTVHRAPLPEPLKWTSSAKEPLSHINYESGGNPPTNSPKCLQDGRRDANSGISAPSHTAGLRNSPSTKGQNRMVTKVQLPMLKESQNLGRVFQDMEAAEVFIDFTEEVRHTEANPMCFDSLKPYWAMPKFKTKINRSTKFAQVNLISAAPTLQNLRIGLRRRQNGKSIVLAKQRGSWPKVC